MTELPPATPPQYLDRAAAPALAYRLQKGRADAPCFVWLGGYASDMRGNKAETVSRWARARNASYLRFDYRGHGESAGDFEDGTVSHWRDDALAVITALTTGPLVLIGSSMGAWIACHVINALKDKVAGFVGIAPAPDFVTELFWPGLSTEDQRRVMEDGRISFPSDYDDSEMVYTKRLVEDGRACRVLKDDIVTGGPVHILQGTGDVTVPWTHAKRLADHITSPDVTLTLIKGGDHRLSEPEDLERLCRTLALFIAPASG